MSMAGKNDDDSVGGPRDLSADFHSRSRYLNCFACCTKVLRYLGNIMVLFTCGLVLLSWYCVVVLQYGPLIMHDNVGDVLVGVFVSIPYSAMIAMILWSYLATHGSCPGRVPSHWHPFTDDEMAESELERLSFGESDPDKPDPRRARWCRKCKAWKPERSHHCSTTGACVLKLDHWCVWVLNAVGLLNYKFFLLFMFWTFWGALVGVLLLLPRFFTNFHDQIKDVSHCVVRTVLRVVTGRIFMSPCSCSATLSIITIVFDTMFVLCLGGFLVMHFQLLSANCTTIEMYEKHRITPWPYNKGLRRNFEDIFGSNKLRWVIPTYNKTEQQALLDSCLSKQRFPFRKGNQSVLDNLV